MRKLVVFESTSVDGYFADSKGDLSWAHEGSDDPEYKSFVADNAKTGDTLVFGRITYEMMVSYWPTPAASKNDPTVAERMNSMTKVVFSRTLADASWENTKLVKTGLVEEIRKMKDESGKAVVILGSGSIVSQLAQAELIDEYQFVVNPVVLGNGRKLFATEAQQKMKLTRSKSFPNGKVLLCFSPIYG